MFDCVRADGKLMKKNAFFDLGIIVGIVVLLDQLTKYLVRTNLAVRETWIPWESLSFVRIVHWMNTGISFGMFQGRGWIFTVVGIVVVLVIIFYYARMTDKPRVIRYSLAFMLGGAIGNLIDRITLGYVVDFIWIGSYPVFNVADSCIVCGAIVLIIFLWFEKPDQPEVPEKAGSNE